MKGSKNVSSFMTLVSTQKAPVGLTQPVSILPLKKQMFIDRRQFFSKNTAWKWQGLDLEVEFEFRPTCLFQCLHKPRTAATQSPISEATGWVVCGFDVGQGSWDAYDGEAGGEGRGGRQQTCVTENQQYYWGSTLQVIKGNTQHKSGQGIGMGNRQKACEW